MPRISTLDTFIEISTGLLEVTPEKTRVSIRYHTKPKKGIKKQAVNPVHSYISFRIYNPNSGICYVYKTNKSKDVSRILSAVGPMGVQFTRVKRVDNKEEKFIENGRGFASLMANTEYEHKEEPEEKVVKETGEKQNEENVEKKRKKKGKKKGKK